MVARLKLTREIFIPKDPEEIIEGENCVVYLHRDTNDKPCVVGFIGKQSKPVFNYRYLTTERRAEGVQNWLNNIADNMAYKLKRQAERKAFKHTLKVDGILYTSWGYGQTNVDYFQVIKVLPKSVVIREIASKTSQEGFMSGYSEPVPGKFTGEPMTKRVKQGNCVMIYSFADASPWTGGRQYTSWYH